MPNFNASQLELNLGSCRFPLARRLTTAQVRVIVKQLVDQEITAQEILQRGRKHSLELSSPFGALVITPNSTIRDSHLWWWNVDFIPLGIKRIA